MVLVFVFTLLVVHVRIGPDLDVGFSFVVAPVGVWSRFGFSGSLLLALTVSTMSDCLLLF